MVVAESCADVAGNSRRETYKSIYSRPIPFDEDHGFVRRSEVTTMSSATGEMIASNSRAIPCLPRANGSRFRSDRIWEKCS
jgi:hypothetical protein